jgi:hypothetical protein
MLFDKFIIWSNVFRIYEINLIVYFSQAQHMS